MPAAPARTLLRMQRWLVNAAVGGTIVAGLSCVAVMPVAGCDHLHYKAMKKVGSEKRDILVRRGKEARESQVTAREDLKTAMERLKAVVAIEGADLENNRRATGRGSSRPSRKRTPT